MRPFPLGDVPYTPGNHQLGAGPALWAAPPVPTIRPGMTSLGRTQPHPGLPSFPATERRGGAPDRSTQARGGANSSRTITGPGREPIQTLKQAVLSSLEEPGWTPLPNVLRLSCGATPPAAGKINDFLMACPVAEAAPPAGARGAGSFKRLLGCSLSRETLRSGRPTTWETRRGSISGPPRPRRPWRPTQMPSSSDRGSTVHLWIALVLSRTEGRAGRPTGASLPRGRDQKRSELARDTTSAVL